MIERRELQTVLGWIAGDVSRGARKIDQEMLERAASFLQVPLAETESQSKHLKDVRRRVVQLVGAEPEGLTGAYGNSASELVYLWQAVVCDGETYSGLASLGPPDKKTRIKAFKDTIAPHVADLLLAEDTHGGHLGLQQIVRFLDTSPPTTRELFAPRANEDPVVADWFRFGSINADGRMPDYLDRDIDERLDEFVERATKPGLERSSDRIFAVVGPPKSGKTRSILEALRRSEDLTQTPLHILTEPRHLNAYLRNKSRGTDAIVLLDDLHRWYIRDNNEIAPNLEPILMELARTGSIIAATIHTPIVDAAEPANLGVAQHDHHWMNHTLNIARLRNSATSREIERHQLAAATGADKIGEFYGGTDALIQRAKQIRVLGTLDPEQHARQAAFEALIDSTLFRQHGVDDASLRTMADHYWKRTEPNRLLTDQMWDEAFDWLLEPVSSSSSLSLAVRESQNLKLLAALRQTFLAERIPTRDRPVEDVRCAAAACLHAEMDALAEAWLRKGAEAPHNDPRSMMMLATLLSLQGDDADLDEAIEFCRKGLDGAADLDAHVPFTMFVLGDLLGKRDGSGDLPEAIKWCRKAADAPNNDSAAMLKLGDLLERRDEPGDLDEAIEWCQSAASERNDKVTVDRLSQLLERRGEPGDLDEAIRWYREQLNLQMADSNAMYKLGDLLERRDEPGDLDEAVQLWRAAADEPHNDLLAALRLAQLFTGKKDLDQAVRWGRKVLSSGELDDRNFITAFASLLTSRSEPGDKEEAKYWRKMAN